MCAVQARPNESLVLARKGELANLGLGARGVRLPGRAYAVVPSGKEEATFEMTQETRDGIPLRFKGIVIYRVVRPELAARLFDFTQGRGHEQIQSLISQLCMGELRAVTAGLTMQECIEGRKTTLTEAIARALDGVVGGAGNAEEGWGIELDVVQVAQVFLTDEDLRQKLEAEVRERIRSTSERSRIQTERELRLAEIDSQRELEEEGQKTERLRVEREREKAQLNAGLERDRADAEAPVRLLRQKHEAEALEHERELRKIENAVLALRVEGQMLQRRAEHELQMQLRKLELPADIARALGDLFRGAQLTQVGAGADPLAALTPVLTGLARRLSPEPAEPMPAGKRRRS
ncbi:MAG: SPFH domain-containing protein [Spirochaetales bacterium]|nr:SPFH domain-containing protein [Spirochaetales bacterium]